MLLMKSCRAEHLIRRSANIRLGSLEYFRAHKDPEIGDSSEGSLRTFIEFDKTVILPRPLIERAWPGFIGFEHSVVTTQRRCNLKIDKFSMTDLADRGVEIRECRIDYFTSGSDAVIFCMTLTDDIADNPKLGYDANWKMTIGNAAVFSRKLGRWLNQQLRYNADAFTDDQSALARKSTLQFEVVHGPVEYRSREVRILNPTFSELNRTAKQIKNCDFLKSSDYANQKEYRFCARLKSNGRLIGLRSDFTYIDAPSDLVRNHAIEFE